MPRRRIGEHVVAKSYSPDDDRGFVVTTVSGTVYRLGTPDSLGYRTVRRIMGRREKSTEGSVIIKKDAEKGEPASKSFFKGKLLEPIRLNKALVIEIFGERRTLLSESVKKVEVQK